MYSEWYGGEILYMGMKKHEVGFGMYSLCIDTSDKSDEEIQNFDATTGEIVCVEGEKRDTNIYFLPERFLMLAF